MRKSRLSFNGNLCLNLELPSWLSVVLLLLQLQAYGAAEPTSLGSPTTEIVGRTGNNRLMTPVNQVVDSAGLIVDLPGLRPQALALSPDGEILVTAGKTAELVVVDPERGWILQHVPLPPEPTATNSPGAVSTHILKPDEEGQLSYTGLVFSPD